MTVQQTSPQTTLRPVPKPQRRTRSATPLVGTPARQVASVQGHVWLADGAVNEIAHHVETGESLDERCDALFGQHRDHLRRALRLARIEGAAQTAALLTELIASAELIAELDSAEDWHRRQSGVQASDADRSLMVANAVCGALLGQSETEMPAYELPWPLDGAARVTCGAEREPMGAIRFESCAQPAGHDRDGGVHVFLATAPENREP